MTPDAVRVGLLGCGTVGQAVVRMLAEQGPTIERASGHRLEIGGILVRDLARPRPGVDPALLTTDPADVLDDPDIGIVIEVMGGVEPTFGYLTRALTSGKGVVTANKQLLSRRAPELFDTASASGTEIRFEASVCAAIPVIKVLRESLLAAEIQAVAGIVNGTTNYILTEMRRRGMTYEQALARAQELGYAEADPTEDVNGADAAAKMAILASIAFHSKVLLPDVPHEGIDALEAHDIEMASDLGFVVKLIGHARLVDGAISVHVGPALVPADHPLAAIEGPDNAVVLESSTVRRIMLMGPGAGGTETASAVVADVLSILGTHKGSFLHNALADAGRPFCPPGQGVSAFYLRLSVEDRPGVLARIAAITGEEGVSILTVVQKGQGERAQLVMVLHRCVEERVRSAVARIAALPEVREAPVLLRVLGEGEGGQ
ncbi:MAG: homoserine dehydrogenase [Actinomycetota bacterium]